MHSIYFIPYLKITGKQFAATLDATTQEEVDTDTDSGKLCISVALKKVSV